MNGKLKTLLLSGVFLVLSLFLFSHPTTIRACEWDSQCNPGYFCDVGQGSCYPYRDEGAVCLGNSSCVSGYCDSLGRCTIPESSGGCTSDQACASGYCNPSGICADFAPSQQCEYNNPFSCPQGWTCQHVGAGFSCVQLGTGGSTGCDPNGEAGWPTCQAGYSCDPNHVCVPTPCTNGAACNGSGRCIGGRCEGAQRNGGLCYAGNFQCESGCCMGSTCRPTSECAGIPTDTPAPGQPSNTPPPWVGPTSTPTITPTVTPSTRQISGKVFIDSNNNQRQDTGESCYTGRAIIEAYSVSTGLPLNPPATYTINSCNEQYTLTIPRAGNFKIVIALDLGYQPTGWNDGCLAPNDGPACVHADSPAQLQFF